MYTYSIKITNIEYWGKKTSNLDDLIANFEEVNPNDHNL